MQAIRRLQRHGNGIEIRVPPDARKELGARARDYVLFEWEPGDGSVKMSRVPIGDSKNDKVKEEKAVVTAAISSR